MGDLSPLSHELPGSLACPACGATSLTAHGHTFGTEGQSGQRLRNGQSDSPLFHNGPKKEITLHPSTGAFCPCGAWRGELGSEPTPALFIEHLVTIFDEVRRVLRPDGVVFCNLGDSYSGSGKGPSNSLQRPASCLNDRQLVAGAAPTTWVPLPKPRYRLRTDLTADQVAYVLSELAKARAISDDTKEGRE